MQVRWQSRQNLFDPRDQAGVSEFKSRQEPAAPASNPKKLTREQALAHSTSVDAEVTGGFSHRERAGEQRGIPLRRRKSRIRLIRAPWPNVEPSLVERCAFLGRELRFRAFHWASAQDL